jgi:hypothetical protein
MGKQLVKHETKDKAWEGQKNMGKGRGTDGQPPCIPETKQTILTQPLGLECYFNVPPLWASILGIGIHQ